MKFHQFQYDVGLLIAAESRGSWTPNCSVFSPLTGRGSSHPVFHTDLPSGLSQTPPTDHTLSPLTITAREVGPEAASDGREGAHDGFDDSLTSLESQFFPGFQSRSTPQQHPTPPVMTPVGVSPHHYPTSTPQSLGHVRIKISAKKLREVASPLLALSPQPPHETADGNTSLPSGESPGTSECSMPRALAHQPPPCLSLPPSLTPPPPSLSPHSPSNLQQSHPLLHVGKSNVPPTANGE